VLAVEKDRLKTAPGFESKQWPPMGDATWGTGIHEFYGQRPYWMDKGESSASMDLPIQKASEIIGRAVQNDAGEKLGTIEDLAIDPDRNRIAYVVLTFGGFMGMGDKLFAMPAGVLQFPGTKDFAVLTVDKHRLKATTGFDKSKWPNLADPQFAANTYDSFGQRPYWEEDLRGGKYLSSAAGKPCHNCDRTTTAQGFVRAGNTFCCAGCANKTMCTCGAVPVKAQP